MGSAWGEIEHAEPLLLHAEPMVLQRHPYTVMQIVANQSFAHNRLWRKISTEKPEKSLSSSPKSIFFILSSSSFIKPHSRGF